ncbi:hypothetical protein CELL_02745 [Cellulomonas sp. T2.31MG-18]|uniref:metal-sensitive transcriptional regulator n=1 Tax=unclassified Cellulomonas TaxID=2620175 RepID=UPI00308186CA|nr:hypothetical protein CELD12_17000 [Cellulomonas sp. NTE-D12]
MQLDVDQLGTAIHRLKRAQGQIGAVVRMIEEGRDCEDVVTQLAAVSRALDRAGFAIIATGMKQCLTPAADGAQDEDATEQLDVAKLERLFLSLA